MDQFKMDRNGNPSVLWIPEGIISRETTNMDTWQARARARMKEIGLSQEKLAEQFEMTPAGMQKWLAGTRQPAFEEINQIADKIGVTRTWLTYGIDPSENTDGLREDVKATLKKLIRLERSGQLPSGIWDAIDSLAGTFAPQTTLSDNVKSDANPAKSGTHN